MARINTDNGLRSLFCYSFILLGSINSIKCAVITARTFAEFRTAGWVFSGSTPSTVVRPGAWKNTLTPLDASVSGGSTWRVSSPSDTIFRFDAFVNELCAKSIKVEVRYFMENAAVSVYPWKDPAGTGSEYFYPKQPTRVEWVTEKIDIRPGNVIEFKMNAIRDLGYMLFDQINIDHDGVECDTVTTTDTIPTTDLQTESTTQDPIISTTSPECPTTPPPETCDCCDRCPERSREIHHHHYYPFTT